MTALVLALLLGQNYQGYPVAPRASGMGGAATAIGSGAANSFYNPAAIAWGEGGSVEASGTVYAVSLIDVKGDLGDSNSRARFGLQIIPSNLSIETHGLKAGPVELSDRWGLGVSLVAPFDIEIANLSYSSDGSSLALIDATERTYAIYSSLGYRPVDALALGVSVVAMYRSFDGTAVIDNDLVDRYENVIDRESSKTIGHALAFGLQWRPAFGLRLGAMVRMPLQHVFGFGESHIRVTLLDKALGASVHLASDRSVEARYERPWRFQFGAGWEGLGPLSFEVDLSAYTGLEYVSSRDADTGETLSSTRLLPVLNVAAGAELKLSPKSALRAGFFTDHSPIPLANTGDLSSPHVNRYGGTVSLMFQRSMFVTEIGFLLAAGPITLQSLDVLGGTLAPVQAKGNDWKMMLTYSSSLRE